jgi:hypothetical protein
VLALRQAVQAPAQALSQQTWSGEQKVDPHSVAAAQGLPSVFFTLQVPLLQYCPSGSGQSAAVVHGLAHPVDAQGYAPQSVLAGVVQTPAPSHFPPAWNVLASVQVLCPQGCPDPTDRHAPIPSQVPS